MINLNHAQQPGQYKVYIYRHHICVVHVLFMKLMFCCLLLKKTFAATDWKPRAQTICVQLFSNGPFTHLNSINFKKKIERSFSKYTRFPNVLDIIKSLWTLVISFISGFPRFLVYIIFFFFFPTEATISQGPRKIKSSVISPSSHPKLSKIYFDPAIAYQWARSFSSLATNRFPILRGKRLGSNHTLTTSF